ncbi:hypothetical protein ACFVQ3_16995 [Oerskovia sp. NPDC057915]|uniref:hypothetical protein n=1 Tax=Oerskovia sp. NPDC057915 TaxID=3346280 RepID=UPI0036DD6339
MTIHQTRPGGAVRSGTRRRSAAAAFVVALLTVTLSACAPDDAPGVASAGDGKGETSEAGDEKSFDDMTDAERDDMARKFASCMRDNGVDMPDPDTDGGLSMASGTVEAGSMDEMDAAFEACREFMPNGGEPMKMTPEDLETQREFAKCMREHGVDMPDPDPNGGMTGALELPEDMEAFDTALEACNESGSGAGLSVQKSVPGDDE